MESKVKVDRKIRNAIKNLVEKKHFHPLLIDIGASGHPPDIWEDIKFYSHYIGFDPDSREIPDAKTLGYWKADILDKAVISGEGSFVDIFLTKSPFCSSILTPDHTSLEHYAWYDLFTVLKTTRVHAINLPNLVSNINLDRIDWFKTDSQGIDLRLFLSIPVPIRNRILAVDIEPGLMPGYVNEDLFPQAHDSLIAQGFWLSDLNIGSCPRIHQNSINKIFNKKNPDNWQSLIGALPGSPYYVEARYLRTIEWLKSHNAEARDYLLLCIFALIDGKIGYAFDMLSTYQEMTNDPDVDQLENILRYDIRKRIWLYELVSPLKKLINIIIHGLK